MIKKNYLLSGHFCRQAISEGTNVKIIQKKVLSLYQIHKKFEKRQAAPITRHSPVKPTKINVRVGKKFII